MTWSIGVGRSAKNPSRAAGSVASKAALLTAPTSSRRRLEAVGVAGGQDHVGALGTCPPGGLEADAGAAADHDDGLAGELGFALGHPASRILPRSSFSAPM